jgi:membrane associated rhomboid family serine protease
MEGYYGGILFLIFIVILLLIIIGYFAHEQGDYRQSRFNWFLMGQRAPKQPRNRHQPQRSQHPRNRGSR